MHKNAINNTWSNVAIMLLSPQNFLFSIEIEISAIVLGGAKVKSACGAKLAEFRKTSAISSIVIKTSVLGYGRFTLKKLGDPTLRDASE